MYIYVVGKRMSKEITARGLHTPGILKATIPARTCSIDRRGKGKCEEDKGETLFPC